MTQLSYKIYEDEEKKSLRSEHYNFDFSKKIGYFARWGKTQADSDDPLFSPFGPEILDLEISVNGCPNNCQFCVDPETLVMTEDLGWIRIMDLKKGSKIIAFDEKPRNGNRYVQNKLAVVEEIWTTNKEAIKITTDSGVSIISSLDHPFLIGGGASRFLEARKLSIGHNLKLSCQPYDDHQYYTTADYKRGYLLGMTEGDGTVRWDKLPNSPTGSAGGQVWWRVALTDMNILERCRDYLRDLGIGEFKITPYQGNTNSFGCENPKPVFKIQTHSLPIIKTIKEELCGHSTNRAFYAGWIAGFFDAEGSYSTVLRFTQVKDNGCLDKLELYLSQFNFGHTRERKSVRMQGGKWEIARFFNIVRPVKGINKWLDMTKMCMHTQTKIVKLEYLGERHLIDIQTSERTFYGNGLATHNCYKGNTNEAPTNMSFETFKTIFHKVASSKTLGQIAFGISGVQTNPDFLKMMRYSRENGVIPNFTLSGIDLTDELADEIAKLAGALAVSLYATDKNICYDTVKKFTDRGMNQVNIHLMLSKETMPLVKEFINDRKNDPRLSKMNAVVFLGVKGKGRAKNHYHSVDSNEFAALVRTLMLLNINFGFDSCSAPKFEKSIKEDKLLSREQKEQLLRMSESCESGLFSSYINTAGKFFMCSFAEGEGDWIKGIDVVNCDNFLEDVWYHPKVIAYRNRLISESIDGCRMCLIFPEINPHS